jgi:hypothetical protein
VLFQPTGIPHSQTPFFTISRQALYLPDLRAPTASDIDAAPPRPGRATTAGTPLAIETDNAVAARANAACQFHGVSISSMSYA